MIEILNRYTRVVLYSSATAQTIAEAIAECRKKADETASRANLSRADLSRANLSRADLSRANLSWANLSRANLSWANLSWADLSRANLSGADLSWADLSRANLSRANLFEANLSGANLSGADLSRANLSWANLSRANLSRAKGIFDGCAWMLKNFRKTRHGLIVYKSFGSNYAPTPEWKIEPGSVISENVNPSPTEDCGCGINVATKEWVQRNYPSATIWRCLIRWAWLPSVVVPYNTDGKIRCGRVQLIREEPK
jgi:uncharacterized protein YjbI with pentapeptide repeats